MAQKGALNSSVLYTDRRDFPLNPKETAELWPSVTPFLTISSKMSTKKAPDPDFKMFEYRSKWHNAKFLLNNGAGITLAAAGSTNTVAFDGAEGVHPNVGDVFDVWSSDKATYHGQVVVNAVTSTGASGTVTTKTVYLANKDVADNAIFYLAGNAQEEGVDSPDAWSDELEMAYNSTQIFRTPVEITNTLMEMVLRGKTNELERLRTVKSREHEMKKELAKLLGRRPAGITSTPDSSGTAHITGAGGKQVRKTHGLLPILQDYNSGSNIHAISKSNYNYNKFLEDMRLIYQYGNDMSVKYMIAGDKMLSWLGSFAEDKSIAGKVELSMEMGSEQFGFNIRDFKHQFGILKVVRSPLLTQHADGMYSGHGLIIDPAFVSNVMYRKSLYRTAIQLPGVDGIKDEYLSDEGLGLTMVEAHHALIAQ